MSGPLDHLLLGVAALAVFAASLRLADRCGAEGLPRLITACVFAATIVVIESLVIGLLAGLADEPLVPATAAVATYAAARLALPAPATPLADEIGTWYEARSAAERAGIGAALGLAAIWIVWSLRTPHVGVDALYYHMPEALHWVSSGTTGSVELLHPLYLVGNYPLVNEVVLSWGAGLSRSLVVFQVWPVLVGVLFAAATWLALRELRVPGGLRVLALVAVLTIPLTLNQFTGPINDLAAVAWLVSGAALTLASRTHPHLLAPAILALALAAGTKTTALPPALMLAAAALVTRPLRPVMRPLAWACIAAVLVGGFWYLRNFVSHGSPFWPWSATPWGDPEPSFLSSVYPSFISNPGGTLDGRVGEYGEAIGGGAILLVAGLVLGLVRRSRLTLLLTGAIALVVVLWTVAPSTGRATIDQLDASVSQLRYLFAAIIAAVAVLAVAPQRLQALAVAVLGGAVIANLAAIYVWDSVYAIIPSPATLAIGAAGGGAAGLLAGRFPAALRRPLLPVAVVLGALTLAVPAKGFVERHSRSLEYDAGLAAYLHSQPLFAEGDHPIYMGPVLAGTLAGDRLQHPLRLLPLHDSCEDVERRLEGAWVILFDNPVLRRGVGYDSLTCLEDRRPLRVVAPFRIYAPD